MSTASWTEVDCSAADLSWSNSVAELVALDGGLVAANCDFTQVGLVDLSKAGPPVLRGRHRARFGVTRLKHAPDWPALLVLGDSGLEVLDLSDPSHPMPTAAFKYPVGHQRSATFLEGDLYVTHENGVALLERKTGQPTHLFDVPDDEFFSDYPTDLLAFGRHLYVVGRHAGLHVYERDSRASFRLLGSVKKGYTPTTLQWWTPGQVLLMVGNEDVIAVDTSTPAKVRVMKSCKVKGYELSGQLFREGDRAFVVGAKRARLVFATLDFSQPLTPSVLELEQPPLTSGDDFDGGHFARWGDQVMLGGTYLDTVRLFRRQPARSAPKRAGAKKPPARAKRR